MHVGEEDEEDPEAEGYYRQDTCRRMKARGPMDRFTPSLEELVDKSKARKQPNMDSKYRKKAREDAVKYIARWFYEAGIANTATLPSFHQMLQANGKFGKFLEAPTPYELSGTFLQKEVEETTKTLALFKQ